MNHEHSKQCAHIDHTIGEQVQLLSEKIDQNTRMTENVIQQVSGIGSDLKAFKQEMKPWLEAKIGISLLVRWFIAVPVLVATIYGLKTIIGWFGFHK